MFFLLFTINLDKQLIIGNNKESQDENQDFVKTPQKDFTQGQFEDSQIYFSNENNIKIPLIMMISSLILIVLFYAYYMYRISKSISSVSPFFDIAETETKIDFTIAERDEAHSDGALPPSPILVHDATSKQQESNGD